MNYRKHYSLLISKYGKVEKPGDVFTERHHITPKSHGGDNSVDNLVYLTGREHFIAHYLLWKIYKDRSMALAFKRMCESPEHSKRTKITGRRYNIAKEAVSKSMIGKSRPDLVGDNNPMRNPVTAAKISEIKKIYWQDRKEYAARAAANLYLVTNPKGEVTKVLNLKEYCKNNSINYSSMLYLSKVGGKSRRAKGYSCKEITIPCE